MQDMETLTIQLPSDIARTVRDAVDGRRYLVAADVVVEALADWQVKQEVRAVKLHRLRQLVDEGIASGFEPMGSDEVERIIGEGRAELAARKAAP
ncbi:type II toxin-antitoxin system ParD family antitoxin [Xanthobacteraceae bacterium Astr-EGSB]|uniref:ribbon-helix-helix domain-containing protein n=1 Tax=Astrobacterium formosum TaxID=3069710 RepID=UPI0027B7C444|nr:type II toxin-antitoxin system ParD family antitoxin [Xanthobacteraceae bacterium Astr-EGSB]